MWNRDSWIWWLGIVGAVLLGFVTLNNPTDYGIPASWVPYLRGLALAVGIISGKLATSPLPGGAKKLAALLVLMLPFTAGCASAGVYRAAVVNDEFADGTRRLQREIMALHQERGLNGQPLIADAEYQAWQRAFLRIADTGLALNEAIRKADGQAATLQIRSALEMVKELMATDVLRLPAHKQTAVLLALEGLRAVLLSMSVALPAALIVVPPDAPDPPPHPPRAFALWADWQAA